MTFSLLSLRPMLAVVLPLSVFAACSSSGSSDGDLIPAAGTAGTGGKAGASGKSGASGKAGKAGKGTAGDDGDGGTDQGGAAGDGGDGGSVNETVGGKGGKGGTSSAGKGGEGGTAIAEGGSSGQGGAAGDASVAGTAGAAGQETGGTDAGTGGTAGGAGGAGGAAGSTAAGAGGAAAGAGGATAGAAGATAGAAGATAGSGGAGGGWPTCDEQPAGSTATTVPALWTQNPATYTPVWLTGLTITAASFGSCDGAGKYQCLAYLQTQPTFASLKDGTHQGIKLFVSEKASTHFAGIKSGDVVNLYGSAIRYTQGGQNELRIHVELEHPGCVKVVGSASPTPITGVALTDLTVAAYENTIGPLLVKVDTAKGRPADPLSSNFAIYSQSFKGPYTDGSLDETETLTPYYLPGGQFQGLTANTWTYFDSLTGVFGTFLVTSGGVTTKYRTLAPHAQSDIVVGKAPTNP